MKKRTKLRHSEYYNLQDKFDEFYSLSQQGKYFRNLIETMKSENNILLAFRNIKRNKGKHTPGVDGLTMKDIEKLEPKEIFERINSMFDRYAPQPVRRTYIDKPNGKKRPLGIPCVWDRLFQQCILQVLEPICEAKFHIHSYGFRPNRSTKHAIARFNHLVNKSELFHCVDVDIKGFFDNVNHGKLLKQIWTIGIRDKKLISIISALIKAEIDGEGIPNKGTPQGGILSPLLSNIVLNELDWWLSNQWDTFHTKKEFNKHSNKIRAQKNTNLKEMQFVRYADDFKILCRTRNQALRVRAAVEKFLKERLHLDCSPEKTQVINLKKNPTEFLGFSLKATRKSSKATKVWGYKAAGKDPITGKKKTIAFVKDVIKQHKYVCTSNMTKKAKKNANISIKQAIKRIQQNTTADNVKRYNSVVMGIQNYYKTATYITQDLNDINFHSQRTIYNRLKKNITLANKKKMSKVQQTRYKNFNGSLHSLADVVLAPITGQKHQSAMNFSQDICNYTEMGRELIHKKLVLFAPQMLGLIADSRLSNRSMEYHDNRISKFVAQYGKCFVSGEKLELNGWHCHHIIPYHISKDDSYKNLVVVIDVVHKLIHASDNDKIEKYLKVLNLNNASINKLNKLRIQVGLDKIKAKRKLAA